VGDDVAVPQGAEQRRVGDRRRVGEPPQVDHDRPVAGHPLGAVEERAAGLVAGVRGPDLEPDHHVAVRLEGGGRGVEVEVALVVGDPQLVADEVAGGQVELAGVHEGEDPGGGRRGLQPVAGQAERGDAAGAAVDHHRHAGPHAGPVGLDAEVPETGEHVGVEVDQPGRHDHAPAVDDLGVGPVVGGAGTDGGDLAAGHHHVGHPVEPGCRVDHPPTAQDQGVQHSVEPRFGVFRGGFPPMSGLRQALQAGGRHPVAGQDVVEALGP
jgi:hypothetical protein